VYPLITNTRMPELDNLFNEIGTYRKSGELKELFEFIKKFPEHAPYNAMLIHMQKPGSHYFASAVEWKKRFKRTIKPGARPLVILRPFGPVAFVFELADTEGKDYFPEELINPFMVEGKIKESVFNKLVDKLKYDGILYSEAERGTSSAGFIQINKSDKEVLISRKPDGEIWAKVLYYMVVNSNHPLETKFVTILHELAHIYCGHLGTPNSNWWKDRSNLNIMEEEFEAESVCWLVCERMEIKNPSAKYLSGYLEKNEKIPNISLDTVLKAVAMIESKINGKVKLRKEILVRK
jgi:hypothetical protein